MSILDDMQIFAQLSESGSMTKAAKVLRIPKQTISRRLAELEKNLGVELARRTTRKIVLTDVGKAYALRCKEISQLAEEANRAVSSHFSTVSGTLRITADNTFGEAFLPDLMTCYLREYPDVNLEILLTARKVDLLEENFDIAFRIGPPPDVTYLTATRLGPARLWTVASAAYLNIHGVPKLLEELSTHDCLVAIPAHMRIGWPFLVNSEIRFIPIQARVRVNGLAMAHHGAIAGSGIAHLPEFAVREDVVCGRLVRILQSFTPEVGGIHIVYPHSALLAPKVSKFVTLAVDRFRHFEAL